MSQNPPPSFERISSQQNKKVSHGGRITDFDSLL
jgi:hypothetical protein